MLELTILIEIFGLSGPPALVFARWLSLGGGGREVPAAYNSKTINDNEMKFGGVVKDH